MTQTPQFEHIRAQAALVLGGPLDDADVERLGQVADDEAKAEAINDLAKRLRLQTRKTLPDRALEEIVERA